VELLFAEYGAQRGLRELRSLVDIIGNFNHSFTGIGDAQKNDGIYFERYVVASNDVLRRDFKGLLAKRDAHHAVHGSQHQNDARPLRPMVKASETKNHAALIFSQNLDRN